MVGGSKGGWRGDRLGNRGAEPASDDQEAAAL